MLSHELRTPMNAILGWLTVLRSKATTPDLAAKAMDVIHRNVMAQNQLIVDLLDVSRIVSGKLVLETHPLDPAEPVEAAIEALRNAAEARASGWRRRWRPGSSWPRIPTGCARWWRTWSPTRSSSPRAAARCR